jgi:DNA-binding NtrC family response regulator
MQAPSGGGETILTVDDDDLVLPATKSLIEGLGYRVLSARNGLEALEILRQGTPLCKHSRGTGTERRGATRSCD